MKICVVGYGAMGKLVCEMAKEVGTRLQRDDGIRNTEIYVWRYSKEIAMRSIFMHQWFLENQDRKSVV